MSEIVQAAPKAVKTPTEYIKVTMEDGTEVEFPRSRKTAKTVTVDEASGTVAVRFDFVNGAVRSISSSEVSPATMLQAMGHGIAQKAGDEYSGVKEVEDMVLAVEEIFARLRSGDWIAVREGGDSTAGASVVIKAIMEVTGKDVAFVKTFLQGKLDAAKTKGEKLSRQELYNSFRAPNSKTGAVIKRLEEDKLAKSNKVDAGDLLAEMGV
jgi:hypothetical protein